MANRNDTLGMPAFKLIRVLDAQTVCILAGPEPFDLTLDDGLELAAELIEIAIPARRERIPDCAGCCRSTDR